MSQPKSLGLFKTQPQYNPSSFILELRLSKPSASPELGVGKELSKNGQPRHPPPSGTHKYYGGAIFNQYGVIRDLHSSLRLAAPPVQPASTSNQLQPASTSTNYAVQFPASSYAVQFPASSLQPSFKHLFPVQLSASPTSALNQVRK